MPNVLHVIALYIESLSYTLPLGWFIFVGSFIEEVISPIPSALITTIVGSLASVSDHHLLFILWLSVLGSLGKTLASVIFYVLADRLEDVSMRYIGPLLGITHEDVENLGNQFTKGWKDDLLIFSLRAMPIAPTLSVSILSGLIKVNFRSFILMTFAGYCVRIGFLLLLAFAGMDILVSVRSSWIGLISTIVGVGTLIVFPLIFIRYIHSLRSERMKIDQKHDI